MPKKRHQGNYSKPQSTAPASLSSSSSVSPRSSNHDDHPRSVNERLAELRRITLRTHTPPGHGSLYVAPGSPSLPPAVRRILQLPETPAPPPRRPVRSSGHGPRPPPGPAAPRSWMSRPERAVLALAYSSEQDSECTYHDIPGCYHPGRGSLLDVVLRQLAADWEFQKSYNRYYLFELPTHVKGALIGYLARWHSKGVSMSDLRAILLPCPTGDTGEADSDGSPPPTQSHHIVNEELSDLDLTGSLGRSLKLRELTDFLFPTKTIKSVPATSDDLQESWDTPSSSGNNTSTITRPLLPNLTHLSLAITPSSAPTVSWRHLLSFSTHFPTLTHLSLANWPEPCLTPNAKHTAASVTNAVTGRSIQYGGTGPYSHSLDEDWSEAVLVLRRLARHLYGLEWLDLSGCAGWALPGLTTAAEGDKVDWVGDWGKVETVVLWPRVKGDEGSDLEKELYEKEVGAARKLERYIRSQRGGVGRGITVATVPSS